MFGAPPEHFFNLVVPVWELSIHLLRDLGHGSFYLGRAAASSIA